MPIFLPGREVRQRNLRARTYQHGPRVSRRLGRLGGKNAFSPHLLCFPAFFKASAANKRGYPADSAVKRRRNQAWKIYRQFIEKPREFILFYRIFRKFLILGRSDWLRYHTRALLGRHDGNCGQMRTRRVPTERRGLRALRYKHSFLSRVLPTAATQGEENKKHPHPE